MGHIEPALRTNHAQPSMTNGHVRAGVSRKGFLGRLKRTQGMTITVLLLTILTGQNHTVVAEYDTPQACEAAVQAHQNVLLANSITIAYSCSPKAGSR